VPKLNSGAELADAAMPNAGAAVQVVAAKNAPPPNAADLSGLPNGEIAVAGEYAGDVGEYRGDVGEYAGDVGEYAGDVGEYAGDVQHADEA
jgi:hypothetical protein